MTVQAVILAAGMGTRLARPHPKSMTQLDDGRTIMEQQVENLRSAFGDELHLTIVVGYKLEQIMEHMPDASFVYNEAFDQTNTSKSLLKALRNSFEGGVLWMNGDVVFDPAMLGSWPHSLNKTNPSLRWTPLLSLTRKSNTPLTATGTSRNCPRPSKTLSAKLWALIS